MCVLLVLVYKEPTHGLIFRREKLQVAADNILGFKLDNESASSFPSIHGNLLSTRLVRLAITLFCGMKPYSRRGHVLLG